MNRFAAVTQSVKVTNWPAPDRNAVEAIRAAWDTYNLTFAALIIAVIAAIVAGIALSIAIKDANNNAIQLRLLLSSASKKPNIRLTFHDNKVALRATRFANPMADLLLAGGTEEVKARLRTEPQQINVIFQAHNSGNLGVGRAYVRLWLPPDTELSPLNPEAEFYLMGAEDINGVEYTRRDFTMGALYPQVEISSYSFSLKAPGAGHGTIYWRIYTDELFFPESAPGELKFWMPLADKAVE